jgi:hypothetical protein
MRTPMLRLPANPAGEPLTGLMRLREDCVSESSPRAYGRAGPGYRFDLGDPEWRAITSATTR